MGLFTYNSSQYHNPDNRGLGFFFHLLELFLDLVITIIKDLLYFDLYLYVVQLRKYNHLVMGEDLCLVRILLGLRLDILRRAQARSRLWLDFFRGA